MMGWSKLHASDKHQGASCFTQVARGRQCVTCCCMFLLHVNQIQPCEKIDANCLTDILFAGSQLYCALNVSVQDLNLVNPEQLPKCISYKNKTVYIRHLKVLSGLLQNNSQTDGTNIASLEDAFLQVCINSKPCNIIMVFLGVAIAIRYENCRFYTFDSHSRDENGMSCPEGTCVAGRAESVYDVCAYVCNLARSLGGKESVQFDFHLFTFSKHYHQYLQKIYIHDDKDSFSSVNKKRKWQPGDKRNGPDVKKHKTSFEKHISQTNMFFNKQSTSGERHARLLSLNAKDSAQEHQKASCASDCQLSSPVRTVKEKFCNKNVMSRSRKHFSEALTEIVCHFKSQVSVGPDYDCSCCTQTFFKHSMTNFAKVSVTNKAAIAKYTSGYKSVNENEWICQGCYSTARKGNIPKFWVKNGLQFPQIPNELKLSSLEERLVSPRLPFMQLREMPRGGQVSLKGNIVNVPADVNGTIKRLPRMLSDSETIMLKLKRKLAYRHHVAFENIRPNKVFEAAKWLVANSTLFRNEGICVDQSWLQQEFDVNMPEQEDNTDMNHKTDLSTLNAKQDVESADDWTEDDGFMSRPTGNLDTCLQSIDFREFNQVLSVAPGENNTPISLFQDIQSEMLSFPAIYCGKARADNSDRMVPLYYSDICKWELRNVDRRVALCIPNIFFKLKRLQIKQVKDKVHLAIRKCKTKGFRLTAGDILSPDFVEKVTKQNDGFRVLRTLRGSPPYWESAKRDVFAMIRQLGIPTWFCSFSAAETKWTPLLRSLSKLVQGKLLSDKEIDDMSWQVKCQLIKSDPVTCARYFDYRVQMFIKHVLNHESCPIGKIADYFYRVEFQQRGSPHIHMVIWIENAPKHGVDTDLDVSQFVAEHVTCLKDDAIPTLINYQTHRHASTCRKHGKASCRFNFPIPPMPETVILYPLEEEDKQNGFNQVYEKIVEEINELHRNGNDISFEDFLSILKLDYETYTKAIRSSLQRPHVFLKRSLAESRVNSYNPVLLKSWEANMDIQFILDPYSCVSYIVSYISKGQRGLSNLLKDACKEAQEKDSDIRLQVRRIGNQFLSSVEIGAQEAAYLVLQLPLRRSTREVVYVDIKKQDERTSLVKPMSDLKEMPSNSLNVEMDNVLKRYKRRPKNVESMCYAEFASWYDLKPRIKHHEQPCELELPEEFYTHDDADEIEIADCESNFSHGENNSCSELRLACGTILRRRKKMKVIYSHVTPLNTDKEEFFREKLMLYTHWRDEENDLCNENESYENSYLRKEKEILQKKALFEQIDDIGNSDCPSDEDDNFSPTVNPEGQHQDLIDTHEGPITSANHGCFDPGSNNYSIENYDIGEDIGVNTRRVCADILPQNEMDNEEYLHTVCHLNKEQKHFFYHILHLVKTEVTPFHAFLSGGAGCGKSVLIRAVSQALLKHYNHQHKLDPSNVNLILCAPTGKAAHNIGGSTVHSAFCIPANQGFHFKPLDMQQLNTMRARYHSLKVVIIDEISMVGRKMFNYINLRLQEIMGCTKPFGDVSILAVGDLYQLKPVLDGWIFSEKYKEGEMMSLGTNLWIQLFSFFELQEIMRQKDDLEFAQLLNRLREGLHTQSDIDILETRLVINLDLCTGSLSNMPHLFTKRVDVSNHNDNILSSMPKSDLININAIDSVSGSVTQNLHDQILARVSSDPNQTMGLQKNLVLGIGLQAELCSNIDTSDGLTNGATCTIKKFDLRVLNSSRCSIVWVHFDDKSIGKKWRIKYRHLYGNGILASWTPILEVCRKFSIRHYKTYLITRRQFPIYMAAGKTIHKAQGSTLQNAVIDFGARKIDHIHYVGLSRLTSLSGVHIVNLNESKISVSPEVECEMERLRSSKKITPFFTSMFSDSKAFLKVGFHNCRSLQKHFQHIKSEHDFMLSDIIGLVETRVYEAADKYRIDGFSLFCSNRNQCAHGVAVYIKTHLEYHMCSFLTLATIECAVVHVHAKVIVYIYCPPKSASLTNFNAFLSQLSQYVSPNTNNEHFKNVHLIIMGDFNYDYQKDNRYRQAFSGVLLKQLIHCSTTDYNTCLDHIYTNIESEFIHKFGALESYFSDHKPLILMLNE